MPSTCYMCAAPATGNEHVPPRCLFPERKDVPGLNLRKNLISVPSCETHNSRKSKDDEYLLFILISHFENNRIAGNQFRSKILRALTRRPNILSIYKKETKDVFLNGQATLAFKFDRVRVDRELDHIARGLYFHEFKHTWTKRIAIHSPAMLVLEGPNATFVNRTTQNMASYAATFFNDKPKRGDNPEVFWYQLHAEPENNRLIVRMEFYQGVEVIALSDQKLKQNVEPPAPADAL
ncbi:MAG: hypothetical protein ABSG71_00905 [Thermodesulfobacteriota bacterium]